MLETYDIVSNPPTVPPGQVWVLWQIRVYTKEKGEVLVAQPKDMTVLFHGGEQLTTERVIPGMVVAPLFYLLSVTHVLVTVRAQRVADG
jgi:hypothetical protein